MFNCILVRYGEIALKSPYVRAKFEDLLVYNIRAGLASAGLDYKVRKFFGRLYVEGHSKKAGDVLKRVFGIVSFSPASEIGTDLEKIKLESLKIAKKHIKKSDTFAIDCNRAGKHAFTSQDVEKLVGTEIVKNIRSRVDLSKPKKILGIDVRQDKTYIFAKTVRGPGGIPLGSQGTVVAVIEDMNGLVASWMFMKRGCCIVPIFIGNGKKYLKTICKWHIGREVKPYFLKKYSSKKIENIAKENNVPAIITGESLDSTKKINYTVFRPLVGFDKNSLRKLRKRIAYLG